MKCSACATPLQGNLDTYGDHDQPMCWCCWSALMFEETPTLNADMDYVYVSDDQPALPLLDEEMEKWL